MSNVLRLEGFKEFEKKLAFKKKDVLQKVDAVIVKSANNWEQLAKRSAPKDQGILGGGIVSEKVGDMRAEVTVNANYAQFIEFGTRSKRRVPADLQEFANGLTYNKTGDYYDFLNNILDWVKRKGIGRTYNVKTRRKNRQTKDEYLAIAEAIAFSILRKGINPQPFFFIHREKIKSELFSEIEKLLK